jgi:hypothetical protein
MKKQITIGDVVKFNRAKITDAVAATVRQNTLYNRGYALYGAQGEADMAWQDALKGVGADERVWLRRGFVKSAVTLAGFVDANGDVADDSDAYAEAAKRAGNRFDYLARQYAPKESSRQAKSNAKRKRAKGGGRKETTETGKATKGDPAAMLNAIVMYVGKEMQRHVHDSEMMEVLGHIAILAGKKIKAKKK